LNRLNETVIRYAAPIREVSDVDDGEPPRYDRDRLRYPSVLTDAEWQHIGPLIPPAKRGGG
jgi:hypothetical protein